ncbi:CBS domain-containing protein [Candidatus Bathyarchaeota archaeon]|nr:MAG: CBS domain-containing protein [Candidatus Bathyarchaeota archaeon]
MKVGGRKMKVRHIMIESVVTAKEDNTVKKAIEILYKKHVGSIVITDDEGKCEGIFTERDVIRVVAQEVALDEPLRKVMTKNVITIGEDATFEEARRCIISHGIRHLPVVNRNGKLVGLLAIRDFLDEVFGIKFLKPY